MDLTPLRYRDFRLLWTGELLSETGSNITLVAVYIQVYRLTGSALAVGAIGLVQLIPLMLGALFGGPLIDRHDRRRLLLNFLGRPPAGATVVDIGSGQGEFALDLQRRYPDLDIWGVEYSAAGVARGCAGCADRQPTTNRRAASTFAATATATRPASGCSTMAASATSSRRRSRPAPMREGGPGSGCPKERW